MQNALAILVVASSPFAKLANVLFIEEVELSRFHSLLFGPCARIIRSPASPYFASFQLTFSAYAEPFRSSILSIGPEYRFTTYLQLDEYESKFPEAL